MFPIENKVQSIKIKINVNSNENLRKNVDESDKYKKWKPQKIVSKDNHNLPAMKRILNGASGTHNFMAKAIKSAQPHKRR